MKHCLLHLGMPKTASTSIQSALMENRSVLKTYGWIYPVFKCPQHGHKFNLHNEPLCRLFMPMHPFHVQRPMNNGEIDITLQQEGLRAELEELCNHHSRIILSSEALLRPPPLRRIKKYFEEKDFILEPVVYVRSPYSYRKSLYQSLLKFSQLPRSTIIQHLKSPVVKTAVQSSMDVFGNDLRLYPFNSIIGSNISIVEHFFSHIFDHQMPNISKTKKTNTSPSWQATSLLEYIEEECPMYRNNRKSDKRLRGDIKPLLKLGGDKFRFDAFLLAQFKEVIDMENEWLKSNLGVQFCDVDYHAQVATKGLTWDEKDINDLMIIIPNVTETIRELVKKYLMHEAVFSSEQLRKSTISRYEKYARRKRVISSIPQIEKYFPINTRRGYFIRRLIRKLNN